jgi:hypothetical protein
MCVKENQLRLYRPLQQLFVRPPRAGVASPPQAKTVSKQADRGEVRQLATSLVCYSNSNYEINEL